jgi:hypothetical protein
MPLPTPTKAVLDRIASLKELRGIPEREACRAGGVSETLLSAARTRAGGIGWNYLAAIADGLWRKYEIRRDWLLWGEGRIVEGPEDGAIIREGAGSELVPARAIRPRKPGGNAPSTADGGPGARKHRGGAKGPLSS